MINIYTPDEIGFIAEGGRITSQVLQKLLEKISPSLSTRQLDKYADELIEKAGAKPSFKMVPGYHFATCMCVNDMVVHGIPTDYRLEQGDRLGVDLGVYCQGFHTDASWSVLVGKNDGSDIWRQRERFLKTGQEALEQAIKQTVPGNHIGDISKAIQDTVEGAGYTSVRALVGHGVGRQLHEDPEIPCYARGAVENTPEIKVGMVLAIEVIYNMGGSPVVYANDDGWTIVSRDGSLSGLFEHTVAVTENGPEVLT